MSSKEAKEQVRGSEEWADRDDEHTKAIAQAHPMITKDHDRYARALALVEKRHSKGAIVEMVNWLLARAEAKEDWSRAAADVLSAAREYGRERLDSENGGSVPDSFLKFKARVLKDRARDLVQNEDEQEEPVR
jgi:hypothetical protein